MITTVEIQNRKDICNSCSDSVGEDFPTCVHCACPIDYLTQTDTASCPIKKWDAVKTEG
jgi:hypothetical protein